MAVLFSVFTWPSFCVYPFVCILISSSYKKTRRIGLEAILVTWFNLTASLETPISENSHILKH